MNIRLKQEWITALKSAKYKQGFGRLRKGDCFCVLGVLCDIVEKKKVLDISWKIVGGIYYIDNQEVLITTKIADYVDLHTHPRTLLGKSLTRLNDVERLDFEQLADIIEKEL